MNYMNWTKPSKRMQRKGVVARGRFGDYDVEITEAGGDYIVSMDDFEKDPQGGVFSEVHRDATLEAAKAWTETFFLEKWRRMENERDNLPRW